MDDKLVIAQYASLPEQLKVQVADFISFLKHKQETTIQPKSVKKAKFGSHKGLFVISDDFDEPLEDFKEYMP